MQKTLMILLISLGTFLSACRGTIPEGPIVQRCVIDLESGLEICNNYIFDKIGGETIPDTEVRRQITDRSICFPVDEWVELAVWRDEVIEWAMDRREER